MAHFKDPRSGDDWYRGPFSGFPVVGLTSHFIVTVSDTQDADQNARANAILLTCEDDLATLSTWFVCNFDDAQHGVWVHLTNGNTPAPYPGVPGSAGAYNLGYDPDNSSPLVIPSTTAPPWNPVAHPRVDMVAQYARMNFVAELCEILQSFTGYGWNGGSGQGEALSRVAAAELYPGAYYTSGAGDGPHVHEWLQTDPWPDYLTLPGMDQDDVTFGCGILFLYYLRYQLNYPYSKIVPAGGGTLAEKFSSLTQIPAASAFSSFAAFLTAHGVLPYANAPRDNIFPLFDDAARDIALDWEYGAVTTTLQPHVYDLTIPDGCMKGKYTYQIENVNTEIVATARAIGYFQADFQWSVNGNVLSANQQNGVDGFGSVPLKVEVPLPITLPNGPQAMTDVSLDYFFETRYDNNTSSLRLSNSTFPGNFSIDISVSAKELMLPSDPYTPKQTNSNVSVETIRYAMDNAWLSAEFRCHPPPVLEIAASVVALDRQIFILQHSPDPGPEQLLALGAAAERYLEVLQAVKDGPAEIQGAIGELVKRAREVLTESRTGTAVVAAQTLTARYLQQVFGKPMPATGREHPTTQTESK